MTLSEQTGVKSLRRHLRQQRRSLSRTEQRIASYNLCAQIKRSSIFAKAKTLSVYLASDGEIDPRPIIELCWRLNKKVYLPVLHPVRQNCLWFTLYKKTTRLEVNRYKILEPKFKRQGIAPWALDLVLMPLVGFDEQGGRIGMGGGYYDRTFAFKLSRFGLRGPKLVGLAHELQRVKKLPLADWDVPLSGVISDQRRYLI